MMRVDLLPEDSLVNGLDWARCCRCNTPILVRVVTVDGATWCATCYEESRLP